MKRVFYSVLMAAFAVTHATAQQVDKKVYVDFEEAPVELFNNDGFYVGDDTGYGQDLYEDKNFFYSCDYVLPPLTLTLDYIVDKSKANQVSKSWDGVSMSKVKGNDPQSILAEHMSVSGGGYKGSNTFGVVTGNAGIIFVKKGQKIQSLCLSNNVRALDIIQNGIKSGEGKFQEGDQFKIWIHGFKGTSRSNRVKVSEKYVILAEFKDGKLKYEKDWMNVDLSKFSEEVDGIQMFSSAPSEGLEDKKKEYLDVSRFCVDHITVVNKITNGIEDIDNGRDEVYEVARYDAGGNRLTAPQKGLNIVRMSDGTVRKTVVK